MRLRIVIPATALPATARYCLLMYAELFALGFTGMDTFNGPCTKRMKAGSSTGLWNGAAAVVIVLR